MADAGPGCRNCLSASENFKLRHYQTLWWSLRRFPAPSSCPIIITFFIIEVLPFEKQSCLPDNPSRYSVLLADHLILTIHGYEPALGVAVYNELHSTHPLLCAVEVAAPKAAD